MPSNKYWEKRLDEISKIQFEKATQAEKEIIEQFEKANKYIEERIQLYYMRYSSDYGVSLAGSRKILSNPELKSFRMTLEEFREKAQNNKDGKWTQELDEVYLRQRISRLEAIKAEINNKIYEVKSFQDKTTSNHLMNTYEDSYYKTMYELEKISGIGLKNFSGLNEDGIKNAVYTKWLDKKNFSERIWSDRDRLISNTNKIIMQGLITGSSSEDMIKKLQKEMNISRSRASAVIMTETTFVIGKANTDMYKKFGVEEYEVIETLDSITCKVCSSMDGKRFKVSEKMEGVNAPPFHTNCRGTTIPVSKYEEIWGKGDRISRDDEGNTYYKSDIGNLAFEEYMHNKGFNEEFTSSKKYDINLTDDEKYALNSYISSESYKINEKLRDGIELSENDRVFINNLDNALDKMPNYTGLLRRSLEFSDDKLEKFLMMHQIDAEVEYEAYTSMTSDKRYNLHSNVEEYVYSKKAKNISKYNSAEQEKIYKRNSRFKVKEIEKVDNTYYILLEEL